MRSLLGTLVPYADTFCLLLLCLGALWGAYRGIIRILGSLLAWVLAVSVAYFVPKYLVEWIAFPVWLWAVVLFFVVKIGFLWIAESIHDWIKKIGLSWSNRLFGAALGVFQLLVVLFFIWYLLKELTLVNVFQETYFYRSGLWIHQVLAAW
jgi:uncharacterized membrane protein required for colicin V production